MRRYYLDNIRWLLILSVLVLHVFLVGNNLDELARFAVMPGMKNAPIMDMAAVLFNPWAMVLMCLIAGIVARYSLQKRSHKQFFWDRVDKLLVPGTLGVLLYQWLAAYIMTYATTPSILENNTAPIAAFVVYIIFALVGAGPLWVAQVLFMCCCVLLVIRKIDKKDKLRDICGKINFLGLICLFLVIWVASKTLDFPIRDYGLFRYRFGTNLAAFLIGYYVVSQEKIQELIDKKCRLISLLAVLSTVAYAYATHLLINRGEYHSIQIQENIFTHWYIWIVMLAVIGCARRYLNYETAFTRYMSKVSYGLLVVHYPILLFLCVVIPPIGLPVGLNQLLIMVLEITLSFAMHELLKRIPMIRYCIFGYRKKDNV